MRNFITFLLLVMGVLSNAQSQQMTVFLIDNSEKIKSEILLQQRTQQFQQAVWKSLQKDGEKIAISYVYENTSSISNRKIYTLKLKELKVDKLSPQQAKFAKLRYGKYVKNKRKQLVRTITKEALKFNENREASHILSALTHIAFFQNKYTVKQIYFLSDMVENSSIRNHYKTRIASPQKAKELGKKDALQLQKKYSLHKNFLKDIQITIYMPLEAMETRKIFEWIPLYWEGVFGFYGNKNNIQFQ